MYRAPRAPCPASRAPCPPWRPLGCEDRLGERIYFGALENRGNGFFFFFRASREGVFEVLRDLRLEASLSQSGSSSFVRICPGPTPDLPSHGRASNFLTGMFCIISSSKSPGCCSWFENRPSRRPPRGIELARSPCCPPCQSDRLSSSLPGLKLRWPIVCESVRPLSGDRPKVSQ